MGDLNWAKTSLASSLVRSEAHSGAQWDQEQRQGVSEKGKRQGARRRVEEKRHERGRHVDSLTMQPSRIKRPGGICDRFSEDRSDVLGTREQPALQINVAINTATVKECPRAPLPPG